MSVLRALPVGPDVSVGTDVRCGVCSAKLCVQHHYGGGYSIKCDRCRTVVGWGISTEPASDGTVVARRPGTEVVSPNSNGSETRRGPATNRRQ